MPCMVKREVNVIQLCAFLGMEQRNEVYVCECHVGATGGCALRYGCPHIALVTSNMDETSESKDNGESRGKIIFKRPVKRRSSESGAIQSSTSKRTKDDSEKPKKYSSTGVSNASLWSFDQDEED